MSQLAGTQAETLDLGGNTLLPGFTDCHMHPVLYAFFLMNLDLKDIRTMEKLFEAIRKKAGESETGEWLLCLRLNEEWLDEQRLPTLAELDNAAPDNPLVLFRYCGHLAIAN